MHLLSSEWDEVICSSPTIMVLFPVDSTGELGYISRSMPAAFPSLTRRLLLHCIYCFYQVSSNQWAYLIEQPSCQVACAGVSLMHLCIFIPCQCVDIVLPTKPSLAAVIILPETWVWT